MRVLLGILLVATAFPACAGVYKWVDEKGQVHYGSTPPSAGEYSSVATPASSVTSDSAPADDTAPAPTSDAEILERERNRSQQAAKDKQERRERCARARTRLQNIQQTGVVYSRGADGERKLYSDAERISLEQAAEKKVKNACAG